MGGLAITKQISLKSAFTLAMKKEKKNFNGGFQRMLFIGSDDDVSHHGIFFREISKISLALFRTYSLNFSLASVASYSLIFDIAETRIERRIQSVRVVHSS